jgi:copper chaperone CopZ
MATQETTLTLPDMSCNHCIQRITQTLTNMAGVTSVRVDLPTKTASFTYDQEVLQLEAIEARLDEAGYPVGKPPQTSRGKPLPLR